VDKNIDFLKFLYVAMLKDEEFAGALTQLNTITASCYNNGPY